MMPTMQCSVCIKNLRVEPHTVLSFPHNMHGHNILYCNTPYSQIFSHIMKSYVVSICAISVQSSTAYYNEMTKSNREHHPFHNTVWYTSHYTYISSSTPIHSRLQRLSYMENAAAINAMISPHMCLQCCVYQRYTNKVV